MGRDYTHHTRLAGVLIVALLGAGSAVIADPLDDAVAIELPAQPLGDALRELAKASGLQLLFDPNLVAGRQAPTVAGTLSPREALKRLLHGTELEAHAESPGVLVIRVRASTTVPSVRGIAPTVARAAAEAEPESGEAHVIEKVVVTAQKREQNLQDVPIAISAFTADQIEARGISGLFDLASTAPNLQVSRMPETSTTPQIGMRGRTQHNSVSHLGQPVGLYVDGVYLGTPVGAALDLVELKRIEVLRGPQGTLFGRNTLAGAVNFITRKPSGQFAGSTSVDFGNYNSQIYRLNMDLPRVGIASVSVAGRVERRDGWRKLAAGGPEREASDRRNEAARVAAQLDISDDLDALYTFDISNFDQTVPAGNLYHANPAFWNALGLPEFNDYVSTDRDGTFPAMDIGREKIRIMGHALTVARDLSDHNTFKSITSYRDMRGRKPQDWDKTPLEVAGQISRGVFSYPGEQEQWTQEFQLVGHTERLNYAAGLYYFQSDAASGADRTFFCGTVFGCVKGVDWSASKTRAYAVYGQVDFDVTEAVTLTAGARYNDETQEGRMQSVAPPGPRAYGKVNSERVTPLVGIAYEFSDRLNLYAKYSEGFKSGGIDPSGDGDRTLPSFKPEIGKTVELGAKMSSSDGRAQLNAAVFRNKITNIQLQVYTPDAVGIPRNFLRNAGAATSQGMELEGLWFPLDGVRLQASYGCVDFEYDEYIDFGIDQADNRAVPYAPKHTFNALADVRLAQTSYGTLRAIVDYTYTDEMFTATTQLASSGPKYDPTKAVAGDTLIESVGITNARLVMSGMPAGSRGEWELALWVRNLTDKEHVNNYIDFGPRFGELITAYWEEPRTYGATLTYRW